MYQQPTCTTMKHPTRRPYAWPLPKLLECPIKKPYKSLMRVLSKIHWCFSFFILYWLGNHQLLKQARS